MITALRYMAYNFAILKLLGTTRQNRSESGQNWSEPCLNRAQWTRTGQPWAGFTVTPVTPFVWNIFRNLELSMRSKVCYIWGNGSSCQGWSLAENILGTL